jgi:catechol 2,3-dioxygenase-like lactoylglutathione lyase family enzyme
MTGLPNYMAVDHISITVSDMQASKRFYIDQLGLPVVSDVETADKVSNDERYQPLYDAKHTMRQLVVLGPVGDVKIALIGHPGDSLQGAADPMLDRVGLNHFALTVEDLPGLVERMASFGVEPVAAGYFMDPDGNLIQFEAPGEGDAHHQAWVERGRAAAG